MKCYQFCDAKRIRRATVFQCQRDVADLNFDALPDRFVLKPTTGHSAQAIMPLIHDETKGLYFDLLRRTYRSLDDIIAMQRQFQQSNKFKNSYHILAEEMLRPESGRIEIPHDFKLYVFNDGVGLIMQKNVNARPYQCNAYDGDWRRVPLDELFDFERNDAARHHWRRAAEQGFVAGLAGGAGAPDASSTPRATRARDASGTPSASGTSTNTSHCRIAEGAGLPPTCASEMIDTAQRVQRELNTPFVRVDVYATLNGCVVGELTLAPGGLWAGAECFSAAWDRHLGERWSGLSREAQRAPHGAPQHTPGHDDDRVGRAKVSL